MNARSIFVPMAIGAAAAATAAIAYDRHATSVFERRIEGHEPGSREHNAATNARHGARVATGAIGLFGLFGVMCTMLGPGLIRNPALQNAAFAGVGALAGVSIGAMAVGIPNMVRHPDPTGGVGLPD